MWRSRWELEEELVSAAAEGCGRNAGIPLWVWNESATGSATGCMIGGLGGGTSLRPGSSSDVELIVDHGQLSFLG